MVAWVSVASSISIPAPADINFGKLWIWYGGFRGKDDKPRASPASLNLFLVIK